MHPQAENQILPYGWCYKDFWQVECAKFGGIRTTSWNQSLRCEKRETSWNIKEVESVKSDNLVCQTVNAFGDGSSKAGSNTDSTSKKSMTEFFVKSWILFLDKVP